MNRWGLKTLMLAAAAISACATTDRRFEGYTGDTFENFKGYLLKHPPDMELFEQDGPFTFEKVENFAIRVTRNEMVNTDLYVARQKGKAPLVIFQHGNYGSKDLHADQARRLATWGMHALVVEQPAQKRWMKNGRVLAKLVELLHTWPNLLDSEVDTKNMILVGHSFGGSAIAIAGAKSPHIKGLIFLDPALVSTKVKKSLSKINKPSIILGADSQVFVSRKRSSFYATLGEDVMEISVKDATHNDAQYPDQFSLGKLIGATDWTSQERQEKFAAGIVASAFSIAATGNTDFAWRSMQPGLKRGEMIKARRKNP